MASVTGMVTDQVQRPAKETIDVVCRGVREPDWGEQAAAPGINSVLCMVSSQQG